MNQEIKKKIFEAAAKYEDKSGIEYGDMGTANFYKAKGMLESLAIMEEVSYDSIITEYVKWRGITN